MIIREATSSDTENVMTVERAAFGSDSEAELVRELINDPSAKPLISLLAFENGLAIGHILFTSARLIHSDSSPAMSILAPLAVIPGEQRKGIGGKLIENGLSILSSSGMALVFVLGHPEYYPRHGFIPAGRQGFEAPYPIPDEHADAWMVQALKPGLIGNLQGKVKCANALNRPELWRE